MMMKDDIACLKWAVTAFENYLRLNLSNRKVTDGENVCSKDKH